MISKLSTISVAHVLFLCPPGTNIHKVMYHLYNISSNTRPVPRYPPCDRKLPTQSYWLEVPLVPAYVWGCAGWWAPSRPGELQTSSHWRRSMGGGLWEAGSHPALWVLRLPYNLSDSRDHEVKVILLLVSMLSKWCLDHSHLGFTSGDNLS